MKSQGISFQTKSGHPDLVEIVHTDRVLHDPHLYFLGLTRFTKRRLDFKT